MRLTEIVLVMCLGGVVEREVHSLTIEEMIVTTIPIVMRASWMAVGPDMLSGPTRLVRHWQIPVSASLKVGVVRPARLPFRQI
jgi:hypothetical protein